jgi:hypothetical protein
MKSKISASPVAESIPFLPEGTELSSTNVQDAIAEAAQNTKQFLVHKVAEDETVVIKENRTLITLNLEIDGFLDIEGGLAFL